MEAAWINAGPGMLNFDADGRLINVFVLEISDGLVQAVHSSINPDKLNHLGDPLSELGLRTADQ